MVRHFSPLCRFQSLPLLLQFGDLDGARFVDAARADEFHDPPQLLFVEPRAVRLANVDDHRRATGKVYAVHQLFADRAGHVTNRFQLRTLGRFDGHRCAQHR